ncbi:MAG: prepilin-type N-terminal cleavage/methylation domain-containing protein [Leptolyngbyaceae bacterium]|nr:prepilin-type N-terminal cleavage/methylation domain-containing protein [Leptolyngbyaceae bacterium]
MVHRKLVNSNHAVQGMSILEIIVVVLIIGVLVAIAAPGWLSLANRQRTSRAADQILQAIRSAQADAKRTHKTHEVQFDTTGDIPTIDGIPLGEGDLNFIALEILDGSGTTVPTTTPVTFESTGSLNNAFDLPVYIRVGVPDMDGAKRCVIIRSLLGATQVGRDEECTPS